MGCGASVNTFALILASERSEEESCINEKYEVAGVKRERRKSETVR